jgi:ribosomal protein S12 methylthiotransferase accessory factor
MNRVLRFKPHLRVEPAGGQVYLIGERERFLLRGRLLELVAPLVDGYRTELEIIKALEGSASPPEVYYALTALEQQGPLIEVGPGLPVEAAAFWYTLGVDAARAAERLAATPVAVLAVGGEDPRPLVEALEGAGVTVREDAPLCAVVVGDYLHRGLETMNRLALEERSRWVLIKPVGAIPWVGPMFRGGDGGPCWECLAARLRGNRPVEGFVARRTGREGPIAPPRALLPTSARAAVDLAALTLARWIAEGGRGAIDDRLLALDVARLSVEEHAVVRRPQCRACGDPGLLERRAREPVALEPRPRPFAGDGGYRAAAPEETYARCARQISPLTGFVSSLGPLPSRDHPLRPVYGAVFFTPPAGDAPPFDEFQQTTSGKGRTPEQARASALGEAAERYSGLFQGDEPRVAARLADLGEDAVPPRDLQAFSERQHRERAALNGAPADPRHQIPPPFDEGRVIDWTPCWSLTRGRRRYLPTASCYFRYPIRPEDGLCPANSNGHAAGNCLEEAILQGFLELVERDAVSIWWYNRIQRPAVDLPSFEDPYFAALEAHYRDLGWPLWVLDVTHDLEIPAFVALARSSADGRFCVGFGCHLDARLGVQRALTEVNQTFDPAAERRPPWDAAATGEAPYLFPDPTLPPRRRGDFAGGGGQDLREDVEACVARAARAGLEVLVLDQTRPDIGLSVAKVVAPGLRHIWPRFAPGRLYDIPPRLGWAARPTLRRTRHAGRLPDHRRGPARGRADRDVARLPRAGLPGPGPLFRGGPRGRAARRARGAPRLPRAPPRPPHADAGGEADLPPDVRAGVARARRGGLRPDRGARGAGSPRDPARADGSGGDRSRAPVPDVRPRAARHGREPGAPPRPRPGL